MYLGQKVGDILTAAHELRDDAKNMGTRDLTRFSEKIVNQIRRILHSNWPSEEKKNLKSLQKVAVAIMKAIEEKDDLAGTISGAAGVLEKLVADLGVPIHKLATTDKDVRGKEEPGVDKAKQSDAPPPQPVTMDQGELAQPPGSPTLQQFTPPLGGNAGPLAAF